MTDGEITTDKEYYLKDGLQQGTVTSPNLFNIYNSQVLSLGKKVIEIQKELQKTFDLIQFYSDSWKLKINEKKCETILFRPKLVKAPREVRKNWKKFKLKSDNTEIPHKTV
ncbi:hypothetical protein PV325_008853, partial [Microctonus aethiopoides]